MEGSIVINIHKRANVFLQRVTIACYTELYISYIVW